MKNKKGFTLIELLAVIVILAILALIAIPIIISIINDSRENSHKRSIENYGKAVENAIMAYQEKNDLNSLPNLISEYNVKTSGEKVQCDNEIQNIGGEDGIILTNCRVIDKSGKQKSKHKYNYQDGKVTSIEDKEEDNATDTTTSTNTNNDNNNINNNDNNNQQEEVVDTYPYSVGKIVSINNIRYIIISEHDDYLVLLKSEPLTKEEVYDNRIGSDYASHVNRYIVPRHIVYSMNGGYGGVAYYSSAKCGWHDKVGGMVHVGTGCDSEDVTNYNNSDVKFIVDTWEKNTFKSNELKMVNNYKARLITAAEYKSIKKYPFVQSNCYWTMSVASKTDYYVYKGGSSSLSFEHVNYYQCSIRPVINAYKSSVVTH